MGQGCGCIGRAHFPSSAVDSSKAIRFTGLSPGEKPCSSRLPNESGSTVYNHSTCLSERSPEQTRFKQVAGSLEVAGGQSVAVCITRNLGQRSYGAPLVHR